MSIAKFFAGTFGPSVDVSSPDAWRLFGGWNGGTQTDAGVFVSERLALNLPGVQACVRLRADALAMIPAVVERWEASSKSWVSVDDHPVDTMLNHQPNEYMTPIDARRAPENGRSLWGNGLCELVFNGRGQAVEMWPIVPGAVWPYRDDTRGRPTLRYRGTVGGKPFDRDASEVLHLKGSVTLDGLVALSPITECREAAALGFATQTFGNKFFANEGKSGGFIEGVKETGEARVNLQDYLNAHAGLANAHRYKLLGDGHKYVPTTIPPEDAQFLGTREFALADLCRMFGVPLELVYAQAAASKWGSGIEALLIAFIRWTIQPLAIQAGQEFTLKCLTAAERIQGVRVRFCVDELLNGDSTAVSSFVERMTRAQVMQQNEARQKIGLNPVPDGDRFIEQKPAGGSPSGPGGEPPDPLEQERDRERKQEGDQ